MYLIILILLLSHWCWTEQIYFLISMHVNQAVTCDGKTIGYKQGIPLKMQRQYVKGSALSTTQGSTPS